MKKHFIIFLFLLLSTLPAFFLVGQSPAITFQKTYGGSGDDFSSSVQQTTDGGYIIAGTTHSFGAGYTDVYLIKTDSLGDTLWTKTYGGSYWDYGSSVWQTSDGGYIIAGTTRSYGSGVETAYLIKTDPVGDTLWIRTYGSTNYVDCHSVQQINDGGYIITGTIGTGDIYLKKIDSIGNNLWTKTFGGNKDDIGFSVQQTQDGGYIVTGRTIKTYDSANIYLIKTDSLGDTLWTKAFSGSLNDYGYGNAARQTTDGGYIIVETTSLHGTDVYLIKTDSVGDTIWTRTFGGSYADYGLAVQQTKDGNFIVTGHTESYGTSGNAYLLKINSVGDTIWTKTYDRSVSDWAYSVRQTTDEGYIITGYTVSGNYYDVYIIKTDENGNVAVEESNVVGPDYNLAALSAFPNPFSHSTTLKFNTPNLVGQGFSLAIYDLSGKLIEKTENPIIGKNLKSGIYFVKVGNSKPIKIIKTGILK